MASPRRSRLIWWRERTNEGAYYNAIRPKAGNEAWLLQVELTFQFPD